MKTKYRAIRPFRFASNPHYLLPATPEAYEAQVEAMAKSLNDYASGPEFGPLFMDHDRKTAKRMLTALGITKPAAQRNAGE
jgi:hypothetical protein